MELIGPELFELSALELENLPFLTVYTLATANIDQSVPARTPNFRKNLYFPHISCGNPHAEYWNTISAYMKI